MKHGEVVAPIHQNQMKNKKVLLIAHLMDVLSVKVPLRYCQGAGEFGLCGII